MTPLPLKSSADYLALFHQLNDPLTNHFLQKNSRIFFGANGVGYGRNLAGIEGFARYLWGAGPALAHLTSSEQEGILKGIIAGTDPEDEAYWGQLEDFDQRMVEMPAIALALLADDKLLWHQLPIDSQGKVVTWLRQIFQHQAPDGNWQFFKVIVAAVLQKLGQIVPERDYAKALQLIENCYLGDGWYQDSSRGRQDYYTPFAFHYYGLMYSTLCQKEPRSTIFKERAAAFAKEYLHFFAADGANVPYGRSLTYRYAVVAFWVALVYAKVPGFDLGVVKGMINRNLRYWLAKDIFNCEGLLTLGYTYPQLSMTEPYNSNVSPYWSNKIFLLLALPADHPYWLVDEKDYPAVPREKMLHHAQMLASHDHGHTQLLNAGQMAPNYHVLANEKYLKFAYSSQFGFSVPRGNQLKEEAAMDSMLGLQACDTKILISKNRQTVEAVGQFFVRNRVTDIKLTKNAIASTWPLKDHVAIRTWLTALSGWQIRCHQITLDGDYTLYETGYAVENNPDHFGTWQTTLGAVYFQGSRGLTGILDLTPTTALREAVTTNCYPNTNLMTSELTALPGLEKILGAGEHWLVTAVYAHQDTDYALKRWQQPPRVALSPNELTVTLANETLHIPLD